MLVFVDYEHVDGHDQDYGQQLLAARTTITYRLEDLAGMHCHLVRYNKIDQALLDTLGATAIFISGNSIAPERYDQDELAAVHAIVRETELPIFGFCGGFQLIAQALGAPLAAIEAPDDDTPALQTMNDGSLFEFGYHPIDLAPGAVDHPLVAKLNSEREPDDKTSRPVVRHAHGLHVPKPPDGFETLASTPVTPVQMAVHRQRKIVGTQFHPEYWTDEHPAGRAMIANFLRWSGVVAP